jgi:NAD(P)-dependent dehydrogenase (short-subunit alcohol dehydrogenase family)
VRLDEKIALVTGAGQGMGEAIAVAMAEQGAAAVAVADRNADTAEATAARVRDAGAQAEVIACDLRDRDQVVGMVEQATAAFGGLDVLVNNAGVVETTIAADTRVDELSEELWDAVHDVNLKAMWLATKFAAPHLRKSARDPNIVNAASVASFAANPRGAAYAASKGGVLQLTRATAIDLGPHIRCNCFCPGLIATPMAVDHLARAKDPARAERDAVSRSILPRMGRPEEVANLVCFLASDAASFCTGAAYLADGGMLASRAVMRHG